MVRTRIAPSPTGKLHIGTARTALFNYLFARHHGGQFIVRIEDTDRERSQEEFTRDIIDGLAWLGLKWDEGPNSGGPYGPYRQMERLDLYRAAADRLLANGRLYPCYCTDGDLEARRQALLARGNSPRYEGTCRNLTSQRRRELENQGRNPTLRFFIDPVGVVVDDLVRGTVSFDMSLSGDFVCLKSNGVPTYNFAVVVDDSNMKITHVLRGEDLLSSTASQLQLYRALGATPPQFAHLPMILAPDRSKLSKRHGATSLVEYAEQGFVPAAMINYLALLGWSPPDESDILDLEELVQKFSLERVGKSPAIFDIEKLRFLNHHYLQAMAADELAARLEPYWQKAGFQPDQFPQAYREQVAHLYGDGIRTLSEAPERMAIFFCSDIHYRTDIVRDILATDPGPRVLAAAEQGLRSLQDFGEDSIHSFLQSLPANLGIKMKAAMWPVRAGLTGHTSGPELFRIIAILGRELTLERLQRARRVADV